MLVVYPLILRRIQIAGDSMRPDLWPGDRVLVRRAHRYRVGDVVACRDPRVPSRLLVKRVQLVLPDGALFVVGDRAEVSTDSRHFGPVPLHLVVGRAWYRYSPRERAGRLTAGSR